MTPFGRYLEKLRRSRGLYQSQLASKIEVQSCYISAMENGRKGPPSSQIFAKIIIALNLNENEEFQLRAASNKSKLTRRVPPNTSTKEYELLDDLWQRLGTLSEDQINMISITLRMNHNFEGEHYRGI